jgi:hypothetical protein
MVVPNDLKTYTKEKITSMLNISKDIVGNKVGAVGDDVVNFMNSAGKNALKQGSPVQYADKITKQMTTRGWTKKSVQEAMENPYKTFKTVDKRYLPDGSGNRLNDPATAYLRKDGHYVVRNDKTGDIVQISNTKKPNWKSPFE